MVTTRSVKRPCQAKGQKMCAITCLILTVITCLYPASLPPVQAASTTTIKQEETAKPEKPQGKKSSRDPGTRHHIRPFTPREKISADQAVAFPVDI